MDAHKLENAQTLQQYRSSEEVSAVTREKNWSADTEVACKDTADGLVKKCMKHGESGKDGKSTPVQILVGNLGSW